MFRIERQHPSRQKKILRLYKEGCTPHSIAKQVGINDNSFVKCYSESIAYLIKRYEPRDARNKTDGQPKGTRKLKITADVYLKAECYTAAGYSLEKLAGVLGISLDTLSRYKREDPKLKQIIEHGREMRVTQVLDALFKRAIGYKFKEEVHASYMGKITDKQKIEKYAHPSVQACMSILINQLGWKSANTDNGGQDEEAQKGEILTWLKSQKEKA
jgi:DNA-binding CsgD family transcriptional regulator